MPSGTGAETPSTPQGRDFSALKTLVEVSLNLTTQASTGPATLVPKVLSQDGGRFSKDVSIVLIGMRGVGKTALALIISTYLRIGVVDADKVFERVTGMTAPEMVQRHGWDAFRDQETALLERLLQTAGTGKVIVLGGGVVEREANRRLLQEWSATRGPVIHVCRKIDEVFAYLQRQGTKKSWTSFGSDFNDSAVWERRAPWFSACSNLTFVNVARDEVSEPMLTNKHVEVAVQRFIRALFQHPSPFEALDVSWTAPRTATITLTAADEALLNARQLELVSQGADAVEIRIDTLQHLRTASGEIDSFAISLVVGAVKDYSPLAIIYTVRTDAQGGHFNGDRSAYLRLVEHGFRLACDFVDLELSLSDEDIATLVALKVPGTRVILSWSWSEEESQAISWESPRVVEAYERAVRLGADVVRFTMVATSPTSNLAAATLQARLATLDGPPLIALNKGAPGQLSQILNPILTPTSHPHLSEPSSGRLPYPDLQRALHLTGLLRPRTLLDYSSQQVGSQVIHLIKAGAERLGLALQIEAPAADVPLATQLARPDFAAALLSGACNILPPSIQQTELATLVGSFDIIFTPSPPSSYLATPLPTLALHATADNLRVQALASTITRHVSSANAIGPWTSAVVQGARGRPGLEIFTALRSLCVSKIFVVDDSGEYDFRTISRTSHTGAICEIVSCSSLEGVAVATGERPPAILIFCSSPPQPLPLAIANSRMGGVILGLGGQWPTLPGWCSVDEQGVNAALVRLQFKYITGKELPGGAL